jgi:hypothetical protein
MYIELEVKDRKGRLLKRKRMRAQSWVGNLVGFLSAIFSGGAPPTTASLGYITSRADLVDTNGIARGLLLCVYPAGVQIGVAAAAGVDTFGILVGTGSGAVTLGQYSLVTRITHGTGVGQLSYGATTVEAMVKDTAWYFRVVRSFTNNSGADITVYEVGLFMQFAYGSISGNYAQFMLARDVIPDGILVPAGATLTVRYIISHSL